MQLFFSNGNNQTQMTSFLFVAPQIGTDDGFLVRQNSELLRALDELEKTCTALREENVLLVRLKITELKAERRAGEQQRAKPTF